MKQANFRSAETRGGVRARQFKGFGITIIFAKYLAKRYSHTFQVERAKFDNIMLEHAAESGCEVWQEAQVKVAMATDQGVKVSCLHNGELREIEARWLLDASRRDAFLGKQWQLPKSDLGMEKKIRHFLPILPELRGIYHRPTATSPWCGWISAGSG